MQIVRLLEHLAESSRAQKLVVHAPPFHSVGQQRMAETESRGAERGRYRYVSVGVVVVGETLRRQFQAVLSHGVPTQKFG